MLSLRSSLPSVTRAVRQFWWLALVLSLAIGLILSTPIVTTAVEFTPPARNAPGRVLIEGGSARFSDDVPERGVPSGPVSVGGARFSDFEVGIDGTRMENLPDRECPLTAVVPQVNAGLTLQAYPQLFFHVPPYPGESVAFSLETADRELVYAVQFTPNPIDGTFDIALPENSNLPPLAIGEMYRWTFAIPGQGLSLSGGILRGEPSADFAAELAAASPVERVRLLAETGIWFDALAEAANLVRSDRDRADYKALWDDLVRSVDLAKMAEVPLL